MDRSETYYGILNETKDGPLVQYAQELMSNPTAQSEQKGHDALSSTLLTGRSLFLLQLLTRILTFTLNQSLVRIAPPEVFGTAAIQFDLICSTVLFLSREGVRNALLRGGFQGDQLAGIPFGLGLIVSGVVSTIYLRGSSTSTTNQRDFHASLSLYLLSALMELLIEPLYIKSLKTTPPKLRVRVQAEGGMAIFKAAVTFSSLLLRPDRPLLGFALGQVSGAAWLVGRYIWEYNVFWGLFWAPKAVGQKSYDPRVSKLAFANTRQSLIKHVLTEGDRIAVSRISPLGDQGGYAVAMNYGSLIARIIFQPLEETLLLHFSSHPITSSSTQSLLKFTLRLSTHLFLLIQAFLPSLLPPVLPLLLPRRYLSTSAPGTLSTYLQVYIPLLSLNGILESFHASSASPKEVSRQARYMIGGSLVFVGCLWGLRKVDGMGVGTESALIYSSGAAMVLRIGYAWGHAVRKVKEGGGVLVSRDVMPRKVTMVMALGCGVVLKVLSDMGRWKENWRGWVELIGLGGVLGIGMLAVIWIAERDDLARLEHSMRGQKTD